MHRTTIFLGDRMSDYLDHVNAAQAYLAKLPKRLSDSTIVEAAKVEAYLALAAAVAGRDGGTNDTSRPVDRGSD
ncbi:hypothetical protein [Kitasatospora sp. NBC_00315]|uniref:hypothetical protein n=1 Tax=Kitasatospora sp. NBC_00315 TaxID=2975963 RepID=UPI00324E297F